MYFEITWEYTKKCIKVVSELISILFDLFNFRYMVIFFNIDYQYILIHDFLSTMSIFPVCIYWYNNMYRKLLSSSNNFFHFNIIKWAIELPMVVYLKYHNPPPTNLSTLFRENKQQENWMYYWWTIYISKSLIKSDNVYKTHVKMMNILCIKVKCPDVTSRNQVS